MIDESSFSQRLQFIQTQLSAEQLLILASPSHIRYLTNFRFLVPEEREALLFISSQQAFLCHASFCPTADVPKFIQRLQQPFPHLLAKHVSTIQQLTNSIHQSKFSQLLIDETCLTVNEFKALQTISGLEITGFDLDQIWQIRMVKNKQEQAWLLQAGQIAHQAYQQVRPMIEVGWSERQVQLALERTMIDLGADGLAFPTIVAFGDHTALPHHQPGNNQLTAESPVMLDFGANVAGYKSDMTRTWWFGQRPSAKFIQVQKVVKQAYQAALNQLKTTFNHSPTAANQTPNLKACKLDQAARGVIDRAGFAQQFIHTTGHGVGLDIHEPPSLNWKNETVIKSGMVITIEPGIYLHSKLGYRYENTILVMKNSIKELTD